MQHAYKVREIMVKGNEINVNDLWFDCNSVQPTYTMYTYNNVKLELYLDYFDLTMKM